MTDGNNKPAAILFACPKELLTHSKQNFSRLEYNYLPYVKNSIKLAKEDMAPSF